MTKAMKLPYPLMPKNQTQILGSATLPAPQPLFTVPSTGETFVSLRQPRPGRPQKPESFSSPALTQMLPFPAFSFTSSRGSPVLSFTV